MSIRAAIEDQIKAKATSFKHVGGAAALAAITQSGGMTTPSCYVVRERVTAAQNDSLKTVSQKLTETISVLIITRCVTDAFGSAQSDLNESLSDEIKTVLLGYVPAVGYDPLRYVGGVLVSLSDGFLLWKDTYSTSGMIRQTPYFT